MQQLDEATRTWCDHVLLAAGRGSVRRARQLPGGLDALTLELETDRSELFVLRQVSEDGRDRMQKHARVLETVSPTLHYPPSPHVIAVDATGVEVGRPSLLMTRLRGQVDVSTAGAPSRVVELARALAALHQVQIREMGEFPVAEFRVDPRSPMETRPELPSWARVRRALESSLDSACEAARTLVHGDFHIANALFDRDELTGIVDWSDAGLGPPASDVGYCRADLALLFGGDIPDLFLHHYELAWGGRVAPLAVWDLAGAARAYPDPARWLVAWRTLGRHDLGEAEVRRRLARFVSEALRRINAN
jgi:aminoglycoside phosphotransferase (APT) family kinase protein